MKIEQKALKIKMMKGKNVAMTKEQTKLQKEQNRRYVLKRLYLDRQLYLLLIPFILYYVLFVFRPMGSMIIAFKDYSVFKGIADSPWVGMKHFITFFSGEYAARTIKNTIIISLYTLLIGFPLPIIFALLLNEVTLKRFKSAVQTLTYLPYFISTVVIAGIVVSFLAPSSGIINFVIEKLGGESIYFLTQAKYFRAIYIITCIWTSIGYNSIVYLAALSGIDQELYEACVIDGGGRWKQALHITIPGILPTIVTLFIIQIGNIMNVGYELIILLYQPATYETADVISTYVYRMGIEQTNYSLSTAVGIFNSVIGFILVAVANTISNKVNDMGLW